MSKNNRDKEWKVYERPSEFMFRRSRAARKRRRAQSKQDTRTFIMVFPGIIGFIALLVVLIFHEVKDRSLQKSFVVKRVRLSLGISGEQFVRFLRIGSSPFFYYRNRCQLSWFPLFHIQTF